MVKTLKILKYWHWISCACGIQAWWHIFLFE